MLKECPSCHSLFITSANHKYCKFCFSVQEEHKAIGRQKIEDTKWLHQKEIEKAQFENELMSVISMVAARR